MMCPTPKSKQLNKQNMSALPGYQRATRFLNTQDDCIKEFLLKKLGRNVVVEVADYAFPEQKQMLEDIRARKNLCENFPTWSNTVKSKLIKHKEAVGPKKNETATAADILRFLTMYPITKKQGFIQMVLKKCAEFYHTVLGQNKNYSLSETSTRSGAKKTTAYYDKMTRNRKLFYVISETIPVYLGMLEDEDLKKKYTKELLCMYLKVN